MELDWTCRDCGYTSRYVYADNQLSDSVYAYCSDCGKTLLLKVSTAVKLLGPIWPKSGYEVGEGAETVLPPCACGGHFRRGARPRCPVCRHELHEDEVVAMIGAYKKPGYVPRRSGLGDLQDCILIGDHVRKM